MVIYPVDSAIHLLNNWNLNVIVLVTINITANFSGVHAGLFSEFDVNTDTSMVPSQFQHKRGSTLIQRTSEMP